MLPTSRLTMMGLVAVGVVALLSGFATADPARSVSFDGIEFLPEDATGSTFAGGAVLGPAPSRIDHSDPTAAAIDISQRMWGGDEAGWVVLSRDDKFPDSLAGAPLTTGGPMLFTNSDALTPSTGDEIDRVLAPGATVYLLGGSAAISDDIETQLTARGYMVRRLAGPSRIDTALAVADEVVALNPDVTEVAVARARGTAENPTAGWADSVTGGAAAAARGMPVVITDSQGLVPAVDQWLDDFAPTRTWVLGGEAALSNAVMAGAPNPVRVAGRSRNGTAVEIARQLWGVTPTSDRVDRNYLVINGWHPSTWAFGMAAAGYAAALDAPVLVTHPDFVGEQTLDLVGSCGGDQTPFATLLGSSAIISGAREADIRNATATTCPTQEEAGETGPFAFMMTKDDGSPIRYEPCQTIEIVANFTDAHAGSQDALMRTIAQIETNTSLDLEYLGETDERLQTQNDDRELEQPLRYGPGWAPILVNWPVEYKSGSWGFAGSYAVQEGNDEPWFVTGVANFNSEAPASDDQLEQLILHELGHVIGLNHVNDDNEVMFPSVNAGLRAYGPGDRTGFKQLGEQPGECA